VTDAGAADLLDQPLATDQGERLAQCIVDLGAALSQTARTEPHADFGNSVRVRLSDRSMDGLSGSMLGFVEILEDLRDALRIHVAKRSLVNLDDRA